MYCMGAQAEAVERAVVVLDPAEFMWSDESSPLDAAELEELRNVGNDSEDDVWLGGSENRRRRKQRIEYRTLLGTAEKGLTFVVKVLWDVAA